MNFRHAEHEGRVVKLAYCLNLHPAGDLAETLAGLRTVLLPLRERLAPGEPFGVGMYLPAKFARALASPRGATDLEKLGHFLATHGLEPFTYNAFPSGGFHEDGLKAGVFKPTWKDGDRLKFTVSVARAAAQLALATKLSAPGAHLSISTHSGMFGASVKSPRDLDDCAQQLARAVDELARIEEATGVHTVLSLEPEPRASSENCRELAHFLLRAQDVGLAVLEDEANREREHARKLLQRHLGACVDGCHAAVEGETDPLALLHAVVIGKLQYSNAIVVLNPRQNAAGVAALLALDEPRYLHQVTGHGRNVMRATDLPELKKALQGDAQAAWLACDRWVCHFHVPVDLAAAGEGLTTTRADSDRLLGHMLGDPKRWKTRDLHLEIETYTWDILAGPARGEGALVDGLEREYRHVMQRLESAGWRRA
ncbi:MAG: metabolite traffic protein EboE [Planctomycetes bacterium]|nr:metabolite traffic protein EboE [Planctomycetota bacterium]